MLLYGRSLLEILFFRFRMLSSDLKIPAYMDKSIVTSPSNQV